MQRSRIALIITAGLAATSIAGPAAAAPRPDSPPASQQDPGRETLGATDGWASAEGGTTGGSAATADHVYRVSSWQQLRAALGGDDARGDTTDRLIYVEGVISATELADGAQATCANYADPAYSLDAYLDAYDPETWGTEDPSGALEGPAHTPGTVRPVAHL